MSSLGFVGVANQKILGRSDGSKRSGRPDEAVGDA